MLSVPRLYLTRKDGRKDGRWFSLKEAKETVLAGRTDHKYKELNSTKQLQALFGTGFNSCKEHVHVLVDLDEIRLVNVDQSYLLLTQPYRKIAKMNKSNEQVRSVLRSIKLVQRVGSSGGQSPTPFVVLQGSSGVGKTQMALDLMEHSNMDVFYIVSQVSPAEERVQPVYGAVRTRSMAFARCIDEDMKVLEDGDTNTVLTKDRLHTYSFIAAMLRGDSSFAGRGSRRDVIRAIETRSRPCILFLDEFPNCSMERTQRLRLMRNVFRSFGLTVVISSTNESARNMLPTVTGSRYSNKEKWCYMVPMFAEVRVFQVSAVQVGFVG